MAPFQADPGTAATKAQEREKRRRRKISNTHNQGHNNKSNRFAAHKRQKTKIH
jgi:hypothetical protein